MSAGLICDQCGTVLPLNARGQSDTGEDAAWLVISTGYTNTKWEACSRSCATELLADGTPLAEQVDAELATLIEIANMVRDHREPA